MEIATNLVLGRLKQRPLDYGPGADRETATTSYDAARLGLVPRCRMNIAAGPSLSPVGTLKKRTFKIPLVTLARLKAYATVTGQYQYSLVGDAITQFLRQAIATMGFEERGAVQDLSRQWLDETAGPPVRLPSEPIANIDATSAPEVQVPPSSPSERVSGCGVWALRKVVHILTRHRGTELVG